MGALAYWSRRLLEGNTCQEKMAGEKDDGKSDVGRFTSSSDPKLMNARVFMGNLPAELISRHEIEDNFRKFGKILGISLHKSYGFVQYEKEEQAKAAVAAWNGKKLKGQVLGKVLFCNV